VAGIPIYRTGIEPGWIDYNGHLRDAYYGLIVSLGIDALMDRLQLDQSYRERTGCTLFTLETHLHYLRELGAADTVAVSVLILAADRKRIHAAFELCCERQLEPAATAEVMLLHVRQAPAVASAPFDAETVAAIEALQATGAALTPAGPGSRRMQLQQR
jgi:betainyl-CoA thioesterase